MKVYIPNPESKLLSDAFGISLHRKDEILKVLEKTHENSRYIATSIHYILKNAELSETEKIFLIFHYGLKTGGDKIIDAITDVLLREHISHKPKNYLISRIFETIKSKHKPAVN